MLSRKNYKERLRQMEPRKERFSIRKFSVGAASVLIGFFLMGMNQNQNVKADTTGSGNGNDGTDEQTPHEATTSKDATNGQGTKTVDVQEVPKAQLNQNSQADKDTTSQEKTDSTDSSKVVTNTNAKGTTVDSTQNSGKESQSVEGTKAEGVKTDAANAGATDKAAETKVADTNVAGKTTETKGAEAEANKGVAKTDTNAVKETAKVDIQKNNSGENGQVNKVSIPTVDSITKEYNDLEAQLEAGKLSEEDAQAAAEKLQAEMSKLSDADKFRISLFDAPAVPQSQDVHDWAGLVNAIEDANVGTINLTGDITVTGKTGNLAGQAGGYNGCLTLGNNDLFRPTDVNIARKLVINGKDENGIIHTIDFGHYSLMFEDNNQKNGKGWQITFNDVKMKGVAKDNNGETSATEPGVFGLLSFGDVDADHQKLDSVTFNNVTANANGRPIISGAKHAQGAALHQKTNEYYTLNFNGKNVLTDVGYQGGALASDDGNAVEAGYINFLDGTDTTINMTQTGSSVYNYGGNAVRAVRDDVTDNNGNVITPSVNIAKNATVTITGGHNVRGIYAGMDHPMSAIKGTVNVDGTLTENMGTGHSTAIMATNLIIGNTGNINITTHQDNNGSIEAGNRMFDSDHYGVIALGADHLQSTYLAAKNVLTDNGSLTISRLATGKLAAPLIVFGSGAVGGNYDLTVNQGATLDLQDSSKQVTDANGMITMFGSSSTDRLNINMPKYVNLQRVGNTATVGERYK